MHLHGITASQRSTGWRDLAEFLEPGWELDVTRTCRFKRTDDMIDYELRIKLRDDATPTARVLAIPAQFKAAAYVPNAFARLGNTNVALGTFASHDQLAIQGVNANPGQALFATGRYRTREPWPVITALPGVELTPPNYQ